MYSIITERVCLLRDHNAPPYRSRAASPLYHVNIVEVPFASGLQQRSRGPLVLMIPELYWWSLHRTDPRSRSSPRVPRPYSYYYYYTDLTGEPPT